MSEFREVLQDLDKTLEDLNVLFASQRLLRPDSEKTRASLVATANARLLPFGLKVVNIHKQDGEIGIVLSFEVGKIQTT